MKINDDIIRQFSLTGKDSKVTDGLAIGYMIFIIFHGIMIYTFKQSVVFSILITVPFLLLFIFVYIYSKKNSPEITDGYNFLVLSVGSFCLSITDLLVSIVLIYEKTNRIKYAFVLVLIFLLSLLIFYFMVFTKMNKFNLKNKNNNSITGPSAGIAGGASVIASLISLQIMNNVSKLKLAVFFSFVFLLAAVLWIFPTCLIIKFAYLKTKKLI